MGGRERYLLCSLLMFDWNFYVQAAVSLLVITAPIDPVKILFFNTTIERDGKARTPSALLVSFVVLGILVGVALVGRELLELLGINLDAFRVVGGVVIAGMGFEMLYNGVPSKAQGQKIEEEGPTEDSGLIMPLSIPLIAGPGAIVATISIASASDAIEPLVAALIGAVAVALAAFVAFQWLGGAIARLSPRATALIVRIGGLILATIGVQMLLGGLKNFFVA
jgi:multiple antibiotic resistance protein